MTITSITRDWGPNPSIVRIVTDAALEDIVAGGWLITQDASIVLCNGGPFEWREGDAVLVQYPTGLLNVTTQTEILGSLLMYVFPSFASLAPISPVYPFNAGVTAHAGGGQTNAQQINPGMNTINTVATTGDSVLMPNDVLGQTTIVVNLGASSCDIYPYPGDSIDNLGINNPYVLAAGSRVTFIGTNVLKWNSFALATGS